MEVNLENLTIEKIYFQKKNKIQTFEIQKELQEKFLFSTSLGTLSFEFQKNILNVSFVEFLNIEDKPIDFITLDIKIPDLHKFKTFLHQGYNNWTQTYEVSIKNKQLNISPLLKWLLTPFGEYTIIKYIDNLSKDLLRSHFYTYLRDYENLILLFCSLNEKTSFTIFQLDYKNSILKIIKDFQNSTNISKFPIFLIYINYGEYYKIFDLVSNLLEPQKQKENLITGYTTWYYHYNNLSFYEIIKRIEFIGNNNIPIDVFQIDDGYQKRVGDWLHLKPDFDGKMKELASRISFYKIKPGIWLAPFICEKKSYLYQYHYEWILKDINDKPVVAGFNPLWSGKFYTLNIYHPDFQNYIQDVLHTMKDWGFEIFKLDFLYAACIFPTKKKTRAMQMQDALDLIHSAIQWKKENTKILGCGIPFSHAFGNVNYTRVGSDVEEKWENFLKNFNFLERVSTFSSLNSTIYRHPFNTKNFLNDPDVFYLREKFRALKAKDLLKKILLTEEEKLTLLLINQIFGGLVFTSDPIENYNEQQLILYKKLFPFLKKQYTKFVPITERAFEVHFYIKKTKFHLDNYSKKDHNLNYLFLTNLSNQNVKFSLDNVQLYFVSFPFQKAYGEFLYQQDYIDLPPHHSILLYKAETTPNHLLGSDGSIFPLSEILSFSFKKSEASIILEKEAYPKTQIYISISPKDKEKYEKKYKIYEFKSIYYIKKEYIQKT